MSSPSPLLVGGIPYLTGCIVMAVVLLSYGLVPKKLKNALAAGEFFTQAPRQDILIAPTPTAPRKEVPPAFPQLTFLNITEVS